MYDWLAEWSKALVLGTSLFGGVGSNPTSVTFFSPGNWIHNRLKKKINVLHRKGSVADRSKALDSSSSLFGGVGSNPT